MKKILLYSDCDLFGGSEHVIYNILRNEQLTNKFEFSFAYRASRNYTRKVEQLQYDKYCANIYPITILANNILYQKFKKRLNNVFLRRMLFLPFYLLERFGLYTLYNKIRLAIFVYRHSNFDLIHINNGGYPGAFSSILLAIEAAKQNKKVIMQINNLAEDGRKKYDSKILSSVRLFITASENARKILVSKRHFPQERIISLPNFVDDAITAKSVDDKIKKNEIINVIEVALLQERKGQKYLIEAIKKLNKVGKKYKLTLIGNGDEEDSLRAYINALDMDTDVELLGYKDNYLEYVSNSDVVVLPSLRDEDMPLIILTAMSMKKPIVSTFVGGISEEIINDESGYLIEPDINTIVDNLQSSIEKAYENRERIGENARARYLKMFSSKAYSKSLIEIYNNQ